MKCFYHRSDLDGVCSGAIVKYKYPECEMIGVDYGDDFEKLTSMIEMEEVIFIVDFSFDVELMKSLIMEYNLIWIDHHQTAIAKCDGYSIAGKREVGKAGCELTWEYIFPKKCIPRCIELLGSYDVWNNKDKHLWDNYIIPFQYGMRAKNLSFDEKSMEIWKEFFYYYQNDYAVKDLIQNTHETGKSILLYQRGQNEIMCRNAFEIEFEGHKAICLNTQGFSSQSFESVYVPEKHDIMIAFGYTGKNWKVSLYSEKIDVSEIAKKHEGGGHKGAAGFILDDIEYLINPQTTQ